MERLSLSIVGYEAAKGMEKVLGEFKIIETEDGYRIEVKGDKGEVKKFFSQFRGHRFRGRGFPFGYGFWGEMGPWCCWWEEKEGSE